MASRYKIAMVYIEDIFQFERGERWRFGISTLRVFSEGVKAIIHSMATLEGKKIQKRNFVYFFTLYSPIEILIMLGLW